MPFYPDTLYEIIATRIREASPEESYTRRLVDEGAPVLIRKLVEEAGEVAGAYVEGDDAHLIEEVADLWYHTLVLLASKGIEPGRVDAELAGRHK